MAPPCRRRGAPSSNPWLRDGSSGLVAQTVDSKCRTLRQLNGQLKFSPNRFDIAAESRQIHIGLLFDLRDGRLLDIERGGYIGLAFAGDLAQLAETFDLLPQLIVVRLDLLLLISGKGRYDLVDAPSHGIILLYGFQVFRMVGKPAVRLCDTLFAEAGRLKAISCEPNPATSFAMAGSSV
jgi:hypothetical protein